MKKVLITGIAGQDGSYLAELLLEKKYEVHGLVRGVIDENDFNNYFRIRHIAPQIIFHRGDETDGIFVAQLVSELKPDEIYDLAAMVDTSVSVHNEREILLSNILGINNLLRAIKEHSRSTKLFFASSSLIYANSSVSPQDEHAPKEPNSPYGIAKTAGTHMVAMYREMHGLFACSGILYNHESPRRDPKFLPKKITLAAARIKNGIQNELHLGDIDAVRDWGFAGDYVEAMWLMMQQDKPEDFVIGTGIPHSVRDLLDVAFGVLQLDWRNHVLIDPAFIRPREKYPLIANPRKAYERLDWAPRTAFKELIETMVLFDVGIKKTG